MIKQSTDFKKAKSSSDNTKPSDTGDKILKLNSGVDLKIKQVPATR